MLISSYHGSGPLCCTDTDTCIGIGRIQIRGYGNFLNNPIRGYVYYLKNKNNNNNAGLTTIVLGKPTAHLSTICVLVPCPIDCQPIRVQFSSRAGAQLLPLPATHPHLLHRPHPRPPSAPWHTTSARSVGASIRQPRSSNRRQQRSIRRLRT